MNHRFQVESHPQHHALNLRHNFLRQADSAQAEDFEVRLQDLNDRLQDMDAPSRLVWLDGRLHVLDVVLDMRVKVEAVRWMLRVSKHLGDPARQQVLVAVRNSVNKLETAFESEERGDADEHLTRM
jgi:hypothetical protein